jgi:hypothetical protein
MIQLLRYAAVSLAVATLGACGDGDAMSDPEPTVAANCLPQSDAEPKCFFDGVIWRDGLTSVCCDGSEPSVGWYPFEGKRFCCPQLFPEPTRSSS